MKRLFAGVLIIIGVLAAALPALAQDGVNIARAEEIITQTYPGVTIVSIQRTQQNNATVWEARLADGTLVYVDAQTGEITGRVQAAPPAVVPPVAPPVIQPPRPAPAPAAAVRGLPPVGFEQALSIALGQYPGTQLIKAELEPREGTRGTGPLTWDMKLSNGMAVYVDATSGQVVEVEPWGGRRGPSGSPVDTPAISLSQALSIAQGIFPGRSFVEIELEIGGRREGYVPVWKIDFGRRAEVVIDANNGTVLRNR